MLNSYQRAAQRRKLVYFGLIVGLFVITIFVRGLVAMPIDRLDKTAGKWNIQSQSDRLDLNEMSQGDVELTGSAIRLLLTGSRGVAICGLWISAGEKQKRQEWNELELTVRSITKLQPHFVTPWLFQSWNLAYNVSVEMDRLNDMYFYISRGINLLAEGESINRNNPDIRYAIAFYYQNKFTVSDKVTTLRCLYQLSCMTKDERNPENLKKAGQLDPEAFKAFCEKNPQLVRRLRETAIQYGKRADGTDLPPMYLVKTPMDVVKFLQENKDVPNRFRDKAPTELEDRLYQFPVLPPPFYHNEKDELNPNQPILDGEASAVRAARVWHRYAKEVIPPPDPDLNEQARNYSDPARIRRMPARPTLIIFRQGEQRAQSYIAKQLADDGWLDSDPWVVDDQRDSADRWFKDDVKIRSATNSQGEWEKAHRMWDEHGRLNGMLPDAAKLIDYRKRAEIYAQKRGFTVESGELPSPRADEAQDPVIADSIAANYKLRRYNSYLRDTNFKFFLVQAAFEMGPEIIKARKLFYEAERARKLYDNAKAIALYEQALGTQQKIGPWGELIFKQNLAAKSERFAEQLAEDTFEYQFKYLRLVASGKEKELRRATVLLFDMMRFASPATLVSSYYFAPSDLLMQEKVPALASVAPLPLPGPYDGLDPDGKPWIPSHIAERKRFNMGLTRNNPQPNRPEETAEK